MTDTMLRNIISTMLGYGVEFTFNDRYGWIYPHQSVSEQYEYLKQLYEVADARKKHASTEPTA